VSARLTPWLRQWSFGSKPARLVASEDGSRRAFFDAAYLEPFGVGAGLEFELVPAFSDCTVEEKPALTARYGGVLVGVVLGLVGIPCDFPGV